MSDVEAEQTLAFSNQTNCRLRLKGRGEVSLVLAPLERRVIDGKVAAAFDREKLEAREELEIEEIPAVEIESFGGLAVVSFVVWFVLATVLYEPLGPLAAWLVAAVVPALMLIVIAAYVFHWRDVKAVIASLASTIGWLHQQLNLLLVVAIGAGVPATAIFFGADLREVVDTLLSPPPGTDLTPETYTLVGRSLQFAFISTLSLLPALLYFVFDREQLQTIREQFVRQMFRLDGTLRTRKHLTAKYGRLMDEALGRERAGSRLLPGRRSPLLVATFVITLGWLLVLLNADVAQIDNSPGGLVALFTPHQSALTFAFLGAYFFALNTIGRAYVRKDLRPKSYSTITVRILCVTILAWVLEVSLDSNAPYLLTFVFLAGIVPEIAIQYVQELVRRGAVLPGWLRPDIVEAHPLTNLEGIDIYDRARLSDEGVTNVEGLAHHDLVELMLYTRIPPPRLVDWVDQAILYLHVGGRPGTGSEEGESRASSLATLRAHGIRTATDLEKAWQGARIARKRSRALVNLLGPDDTVERRLPRLRVVLDVIDQEEWIGPLRNWRSDPTRTMREIFVSAPAPAEVADVAPAPPPAANGSQTEPEAAAGALGKAIGV